MNPIARLATFLGSLWLFAQLVLYRLLKTLSPVLERVPSLARDETLWVFGARGGEAFADNSKYLYLHVAAERPAIRPVWLSKDREVVAELQSAGYEAYHCYSPRGLLANLRAGVVFLTQGHRDLVLPACAGAFTVLLWHGVPLKHISWDAQFRNDPTFTRFVHASLLGEFDLLTIPGEPLADIFSSGLRIDRDRMTVAGYPRNDALFESIPGELVGIDDATVTRIRDLAASHPVVFYLPTFRDGTDESVADHLDFAALDGFLASRDAYLVVKTHPKEHLELPPGLSQIVRLPGGTDPYPFLRDADALVTDYSSVFVDYLLLDRPMVFYSYDLERYRAARGFYFDYESVTPGPVARTFDELLAGLDRALSDPDADASRRTAVRRALLDDAPSDRSRSAAVYETVRRRYAERVE